MENQGYQDLKVWQVSMVLVRHVYSATTILPKFEQYALASQMIRSAISIPSNIAEGWGRHSKAEFSRFIKIAFASACELETQLIIALEQYGGDDFKNCASLTEEIKKMLFSLIKNQLAVN